MAAGYHSQGCSCRKLLSTLVVLACVGVRLQAWSPEDLLKVREIGAVRVSPDGRRVVFTVTERPLEKNRNLSHVWLALADGSHSFPLTRGEKSCLEPS